MQRRASFDGVGAGRVKRDGYKQSRKRVRRLGEGERSVVRGDETGFRQGPKMSLRVRGRQAALAAKRFLRERSFVPNRAKHVDAERTRKRQQELRERGVRRLRAVHVAAAATFRAEKRDERRDKPPKCCAFWLATSPERDVASVANWFNQPALVDQDPEVNSRRGGLQPRHVGQVGGGQSVPLRRHHDLAKQVQPLAVRQTATKIAEASHLASLHRLDCYAISNQL